MKAVLIITAMFGWVGMAIGGALSGMASYYWQGALTATGERFKPDAISCAHRTLPFGTVVRVTNLTNGKSVECRINDRGPAKWTRREIDLSRGAARVVGMLQAGVVPVKIEVLR